MVVTLSAPAPEATSTPQAQFLQAPTLVAWGRAPLGILVDLFLQGLIYAQISYYFQTKIATRRFDNLMVVVLALLSTGKTSHSVAIVFIVYRAALMYPGLDNSGSGSNPINLVIQPVLQIMIGLIVQAMLLGRCWKLTKNKFVLVTSIVFITAGHVTGICMTVIMVANTQFESAHTWGIAYHSCNLVADLVLNCALARHLWTSRTELASTKNLVRRLLQILVLSAIPTSCALIILTFQLSFTDTWDSSYTYIIANYAVAKLYIISWMYTLNSRNDMRWRKERPQKLRFALNTQLFEKAPGEVTGHIFPPAACPVVVQLESTRSHTSP